VPSLPSEYAPPSTGTSVSAGADDDYFFSRAAKREGLAGGIREDIANQIKTGATGRSAAGSDYSGFGDKVVAPGSVEMAPRGGSGGTSVRSALSSVYDGDSDISGRSVVGSTGDSVAGAHVVEADGLGGGEIEMMPSTPQR